MNEIREAIAELNEIDMDGNLSIKGIEAVKTALAALKTMEWIGSLRINYSDSIDPLAKRTIMAKFSAYLKGE